MFHLVNLEKIMLSERSGHKRPLTVIPFIFSTQYSKFIESDSGLLVERGGGEGEGTAVVTGFLCGENALGSVLELGCGDGCTSLCIQQNHWIVHFRRMTFMVYGNHLTRFFKMEDSCDPMWLPHQPGCCQFCNRGKCTCSGPHSWAGLWLSQSPGALWAPSLESQDWVWFTPSPFLAPGPQVCVKRRGEWEGTLSIGNSENRCQCVCVCVKSHYIQYNFYRKPGSYK